MLFHILVHISLSDFKFANLKFTSKRLSMVWTESRWIKWSLGEFLCGLPHYDLIVNIDQMINIFQVKYFKIKFGNSCFLVPENNW